MKEGPDIAPVAALIGDPARANILTALMAGHALTAAELAAEAGITPQTASSHLSRLREGGLLAVVAQGRHRYFSLASPEVARTIEALMGLAATTGHLRHSPGPKDQALRAARRCYHHLAGTAGVQVHDSLARRGFLLQQAAGPSLTDAGATMLQGFGLDPGTGKARACRTCLDWSERRFHLGGRLGRTLLAQMLTAGWLQPVATSRALQFTGPGRRAFDAAFPTDG